MIDGVASDGDIAVVGDVGRRGIRLALTDAAGELRRETIHTYDATTQTTISGALSTFRKDAGLPKLPRRCALAVAGIARGDTISITNSRWFISRSGLHAMLQHPPVIINDFAAQAWALGGVERRAIETIHGLPTLPAGRPGCYCVVGMTTGLGVAALIRSDTGAVTVVPSEMGHSGFVAASDEMARTIAAIFPGRYPLAAEEVLSGPGLLALYKGLARLDGVAAIAASPEEITHHASSERLAGRACELLCRAFWAFAGNAVLGFGAWDGVFVTGKLAAALKPMLRRADIQEGFAIRGAYARILRETPRSFVALDHAELAGAAAALRETVVADRVPLAAIA